MALESGFVCEVNHFRVVRDGFTLVVSPTGALPPAPWPRDFQLDVVQALDVCLAGELGLRLCARGWMPSRRECPLVWWKFHIQQLLADRMRPTPVRRQRRGR
jgi:hypothetical protein